MKCVTTKEHYEKYEAMYHAQTALGFDLIGQCMGIIPLVDTVEGPVDSLREYFKEDPILNNIPLAVFDGCFHSNRNKVINSLAYNVCVLKHTMIYKILKCEPEFKE